MKLTLNKTRFLTSRMAALALYVSGMFVLSGCQTLGGWSLPAAEYDTFTPKAMDKRIMKEVKIRWELREDVTQYCARSIGMGREQAYITPPVACAVWHVGQKECVIVTGKETTHVALGHEVRHCFEGHFHK